LPLRSWANVVGRVSPPRPSAHALDRWGKPGSIGRQ
jgi:hypothetical protein